MKNIVFLALLVFVSGCQQKLATFDEVKDELKAFVVKVNDIKRSRDYEALVDQFISREELNDFYKAYGYDRSFAEMKYDKNIRIPSKEDFEYLFKSKPGGYYDCPGDYIFREAPKEDIVVASELFGGSSRLRIPDAEYYFCEEIFKMECSELTEGYSYKMTRDHKIGELLYIPRKGWRLMNGF